MFRATYECRSCRGNLGAPECMHCSYYGHDVDGYINEDIVATYPKEAIERAREESPELFFLTSVWEGEKQIYDFYASVGALE